MPPSICIVEQSLHNEVRHRQRTISIERMNCYQLERIGNIEEQIKNEIYANSGVRNVDLEQSEHGYVFIGNEIIGTDEVNVEGTAYQFGQSLSLTIRTKIQVQ